MKTDIADKKALTIRETLIVLGAVLSIGIGYTTQKFVTDAKLSRIEMKLNAYIELNNRSSNYNDSRYEVLELKVQELSTSFQNMQLELAAMKGKR